MNLNVKDGVSYPRMRSHPNFGAWLIHGTEFKTLPPLVRTIHFTLVPKKFYGVRIYTSDVSGRCLLILNPSRVRSGTEVQPRNGWVSRRYFRRKVLKFAARASPRFSLPRLEKTTLAEPTTSQLDTSLKQSSWLVLVATLGPDSWPGTGRLELTRTSCWR